MTCIHCGAEVTSRFCPECGQRVDVHRITLRDSLRDFWLQVSGLDGMFFRTLRDLTLRPGFVAREYIRGVRVRYFGPISYFFFMITLLLLWLSLLQLDFAELIQSKQAEMNLAERNNQGVERITQWVADNIRWVFFLAVPFQAFAARFILFRRSGLNFAEHTVPLFYTTGHLFWLTMATFVFRKITGHLPSNWMSMFSIAYFGYTYTTFMDHQSRVKTFLKGVGVYVGGQFLFALTMVVVVVITVVALAFLNPDALEGFRPSR